MYTHMKQNIQARPRVVTPTLTCIYIDFLLKVVAWTRDAEGGVIVAFQLCHPDTPMSCYLITRQAFLEELQLNKYLKRVCKSIIHLQSDT